jgi:hypothetical protein
MNAWMEGKAIKEKQEKQNQDRIGISFPVIGNSVGDFGVVAAKRY